MSNTENKDKNLVAKEKTEVSGPAEQTRPGRMYVPEVDIFEKDADIVLLADMPGVAADDLEIDLRDNVLTITGDVQPQEKEGQVYMAREYGTGRYYRRFTLSNDIDQSKIQASLKNGVMRLVLPKVEKAKPRKIEVHAA
ncbi:Hsp20/alpha crystallin family protein [Desulfatibacillum aliphaticivorans]|uniref:Heat shock protein Hsp20 n=1 Tax=Desulfatibacillum aliphaticivorans TaxID=218208 RepID=B8FLL8_DESAL|nr:Hsp20/alpha crystallin family protein [Desulfatibacillum aliphaticivorans]ACL05372.1 heat shock protein Hsp20 [Desulfatibacillum aliphaticivorans]